jgi:hypothetical protein
MGIQSQSHITSSFLGFNESCLPSQCQTSMILSHLRLCCSLDLKHSPMAHVLRLSHQSVVLFGGGETFRRWGVVVGS